MSSAANRPPRLRSQRRGASAAEHRRIAPHSRGDRLGKDTVGTELPSEKDLARDLGVGRSTVREALRILQAQGLLSGGDTVSTRRPRVSADQTLSHAAASTMENVLRLGQVPLAIWSSCVWSSKERDPSARPRPADATAIADAREAVEVMKTPRIDIETFRAADLRFHRALATPRGNVAFALVMGVLRTAISSHLGEALLRVPNAKKAMAALTSEHEEILDAVEHGRGKRAAELVTEHIRAFYETSGA